MKYELYGAVEVKNGDVINSSNFPTGTNVLIIGRGERIIDETGKETPLRGVRVSISSGLTKATNALPNVPAVVKEGDCIYLYTNISMTFLNKAIINFGKETI